MRGSGDYNRKKKDTVVCLAGSAVVSVFGSGGKSAVFLLWREIFITTGKKKRYSRLSGGCAIIITTGKKKRYSHLSVGCAVLVITTGKKKDTVVFVVRKIFITTGKKKISRLSGGCAIVITTRK